MEVPTVFIWIFNQIFSCDGGFPGSAWEYWVDKGIVTGGLYNSHVGCQPYAIPACEHHTTGKLPPCGDIVDTPKCINMCEKGYNTSYRADKHFGKFLSVCVSWYMSAWNLIVFFRNNFFFF